MAQRKITIKQTIKRTVRVEQKVTYQQPTIIHKYIEGPSQPQVSTAPLQKAISDTTQQIKSVQNQLKAASRRRSLPSGMYSAPVETLFTALDERRKPEEIEDKALYDVFISHASEDKVDFVNELVEKLQDAGIRVWYDTTEMQWGKSLREQIDNGIKRSKFAILVLSKHFFAKKWPQRELDGILAKETITGSTPLPIWHDISYEEVYEFSPTLAGVYAYSTTEYSIGDICQALKLTLEKVPV